MAKRDVVIFGANALAAMACDGLTRDAGRRVAAFVVDDDYAKVASFEGLPLLPLSALPERFPAQSHEALVPLGHTQMNALRRRCCERLREAGYHLTSYVSRQASVWPGLDAGDNLIVYEHCTVQAFVTIGDNVTLRAGANIGHHSRVGNDVFVASGVVTGGNVTIGDGCFVGLGATLRDGVRLAPGTFIGAGAVVLGDTEPDGVYVGNPAKRLAGKSATEVTGG